jgi:DNA-binding HxlR family transcriptional regulator
VRGGCTRTEMGRELALAVRELERWAQRWLA